MTHPMIFTDELSSDAHICELSELRGVCPDDYFDDPDEAEAEYQSALPSPEELAEFLSNEPPKIFSVQVDGDLIPVAMDYDEAKTWVGLIQAKFPNSAIGIVYV